MEEKNACAERTIPMEKLACGQSGRIVSVNADSELAPRLAELGYFSGGIVKKVLVSPLGDPCAYLLRGTVTAIRGELAADVLVVPEPGRETWG